MNTELKGYSHPLSPSGKAQLVGKFPWYFSTAQMIICYNADPKEVQKQLPEPYKVSKTEPAGCMCWFGDWLIVPSEFKDLAASNPERVQYKECMLLVNCCVNGIEARHCPYIWVDSDFAMLAGMLMGFPKKLGKIYLSHSKAKIYGLNEAFGKVGKGTVFGGFLEALGERLVTGSIKLKEQISPSKLPPNFAAPIFNTIYLPSSDIDSDKPFVRRLIRILEENFVFGEIWAAEDASLTFMESELEEHIRLKPVQITGAYYLEIGIKVLGTKLIQEW